MKQLAFLIVSGAPTPKNIAQIFQPTFGRINLYLPFSIYLP